MDQKPYDVLKQLIESLEPEMAKVDAGNKSAGTRARKICQEIKTAAQALRTDIQSKKNEVKK